MQTTVDFLRHGEVIGGTYYRGSTDDLLNARGWQQMKHAVANRHWHTIISSPLHRCLDFAQYISQKTHTPLTVETYWQEIHFGDWEQKTATQINSEQLTLFYQDPINNTPKHAENFAIFLARIQQAWDHLIKQYAGKHILVITHAGVIRALFSLLLGLPVHKIFNVQIKHASLTRFQCLQEGAKSSTENQTNTFVQLQFHNIV